VEEESGVNLSAMGFLDFICLLRSVYNLDGMGFATYDAEYIMCIALQICVSGSGMGRHVWVCKRG